MSDANAPAGGAFLLEPAGGDDGGRAIFTPELFSTDARLLEAAVREFFRKEVVPANARLEAHEPGLMQGLLRRAGELGILGMAVPEAYGGLDLPKSQIALLTEAMALNPSFAISAGVHSGVATLPLLFFGTKPQKDAYLPKLASGDWIGAFALSEESSGSDALGARATAALSADGSHYNLNGSKLWITNGSFADLFTCFAIVPREGFTAFLVERAFRGVAAGREEEKLGLRGSSTTRITLDGVRVPGGNVLGEVGKGRRPALYALNLGRFAIAATALGMCKENLRIATRYAKERKQFGRPIAEFGLVRAKLADMAIRTFVLESMLYRTAGYLDDRFGAIDANAPEAQQQYLAAAEEYAVECAALKVFGSEALDFVVDEALQIHGGYGFSEEFAVAQAYRDARVFRIFEGTNEINRLTIVDQLVRRAAAGRLPLWNAVDGAAPTVASAPPPASGTATGRAGGMVVLCSTAREALATAYRRYGERLSEEQEVVGMLADTVIAAYAGESAWLRSRQTGNSTSMAAAAQVYGFETGIQCDGRLLEITRAIGLPGPMASDARPNGGIDTVALRRQAAAAVIERDGYPW
jgi:alkylation response protein AidB-like acyl-CoA dehydrogenase